MAAHLAPLTVAATIAATLSAVASPVAGSVAPAGELAGVDALLVRIAEAGGVPISIVLLGVFVWRYVLPQLERQFKTALDRLTEEAEANRETARDEARAMRQTLKSEADANRESLRAVTESFAGQLAAQRAQFDELTRRYIEHTNEQQRVLLSAITERKREQ